MESKKIKELIETIIEDLYTDKSINKILLKVQVIAANLDNNDFSAWIGNEQNGYPNSENLPDYRVLNATIKADISRPFEGVYNKFPIPSDIFGSKEVDNIMSTVYIWQSLSEVEDLCSRSQSDCVSFTCPAAFYLEVNKFVRGNVQQVWRETPVSSLANIVNIFKSRLLSFFLELDKQMETGIDFFSIDKNEISDIVYNYYNVTSTVTNIGEGTINTGDIIVDNNIQYITEEQQKEQIKQIVSKLKEEIDKIGNEELSEYINDIQQECQKTSWLKKSLKTALYAIQGIATGITANQLTPLVNQALSLF